MKYTDQIPKTVYTDIEVEVKDGITYFHTWDEDDEPEDYYKLNIKKDLRFETLYDITITKIRNYDTDYSIRWWETNDDVLPYNLRHYFSGEKEIKIMTEEQFDKVKKEVLERLK